MWPVAKTLHPKKVLPAPNMKCVKYVVALLPAVATMSIPAYTEPEVKFTVLLNALLMSSVAALLTVIAP